MTLRSVENGLADYRTCRKCLRTLPMSAFHKREGRHRWDCRDCRNEWHRARYARVGRPTQVRTEAQKLRRREKQRERLYGATPEVVAKLRAQSGNTCFICGTDRPAGRGDFHIDHDHTTGQIRGLLCQACNTRLGVVEAWYLPNINKITLYLKGPLHAA